MRLIQRFTAALFALAFIAFANTPTPLAAQEQTSESTGSVRREFGSVEKLPIEPAPAPNKAAELLETLTRQGQVEEIPLWMREILTEKAAGTVFSQALREALADGPRRIPANKIEWTGVRVDKNSTETTIVQAVATGDSPADLYLITRDNQRINLVSGTWKKFDLQHFNIKATPGLPYNNDGIFWGIVEAYSPNPVLVGRAVNLDVKGQVASSNVMVPTQGSCGGACRKLLFFWHQGTQFSNFELVLNRLGWSFNELVKWIAYDEKGFYYTEGSLSRSGKRFDIYTKVDFGTKMGALPLGFVVLEVSSQNDQISGSVTYTNDAKKYGSSEELICDQCDPCLLGSPCYNSNTTGCPLPCIKPVIVVQSGSTNVQVGVPFSVVLTTQTGDVVLSTGTLPSGVTKTNVNTEGTIIKVAGTMSQATTIDVYANRSIPSNCSDSVKITATGDGHTCPLAITKVAGTTPCAPAGGTALVTFDVTVSNPTNGALVANTTDPQATNCSKTGLSIPAHGFVPYSCTGAFPPGTHTNTITVTANGHSGSTTITSPSFTVAQCPSVCEGLGSPSFDFEPVNTTATALNTRARLTYANGFSGVITFSEQPDSGFLGGSAAAGAWLAEAFDRLPAGSLPKVITGKGEVKKGSDVCTTILRTVTVPPKDPTCEQANPPDAIVTGKLRTFWSNNQGVKVGANVQLLNEGEWVVKLFANGSTLKDEERVDLSCLESKTFEIGSQAQEGIFKFNGKFFYGCKTCHTSSTFHIEIWRNGSQWGNDIPVP
ncbi:MAG: hypothetical protein KBD16_01315 [Candidatus Pacebacteria bacterium]|nr:hypothetical protein [Candidatus Paceibacterota bacterium]